MSDRSAGEPTEDPTRTHVRITQWRILYWNGDAMEGCPDRILRLLEAEERAAMVTVTEKGTEAGAAARRYLTDRLEGPGRPSLDPVRSEMVGLDLSRLTIEQREQLLRLTELATTGGSTSNGVSFDLAQVSLEPTELASYEFSEDELDETF